jgi:hypothetical protein
MATSNTLKRLSDRIDQLEILLTARPGLVTIVQQAGESDDDAVARHYRERPRDRDAALTVMVRRFC